MCVCVIDVGMLNGNSDANKLNGTLQACRGSRDRIQAPKSSIIREVVCLGFPSCTVTLG